MDTLCCVACHTRNHSALASMRTQRCWIDGARHSVSTDLQSVKVQCLQRAVKQCAMKRGARARGDRRRALMTGAPSRPNTQLAQPKQAQRRRRLATQNGKGKWEPDAV